MAFNKDKYRKAFDKHKQGGEFWNPDEGETKVYVHPPCRDDDTYEPTDGTNFIPVGLHYKVGKDGKMIICLDPEKNPIIKHPFIAELLKAKGVTLDDDECPVCKAIYEGEMGEDAAGESRFQMRFLWGITPIAYHKKASQPWMDVPADPGVLFCGKTLYEGLIKIILEEGDITDPTEAILAKVTRDGTGMTTKYQVATDTASLKKPMKLNKATKRAVKDVCKQDGDCDLFKVLANMIKSPGEAAAAVSGIKVEDGGSNDDDEPESDASKACFGFDYDAEDDECTECELHDDCLAKCGGEEAVEADDEEEGGEDDDESPEEEAEEEADDEGDAPEDDDEKPRCYGKECEDDEDCNDCALKEECAEECDADVPWRKKKKKKPAGKKAKAKKGAKKKSKPEPEDDGDTDAELDDLENELEDMGNAAKKKGGKKSTKKSTSKKSTKKKGKGKK